jgi:integrase
MAKKANPKRRCSTAGCKGIGRYLGRIMIDGRYEFLGYYCMKKERTAAQEAKRRELAAAAEQAAKPKSETITCDAWCDRYLAKVEREQKESSLSTARQALKRFREDFGDRPVGSIEDVDAEDWINTLPPSSVPPIVTCMNYAVEMRVIAHNPFRGKSKRGRGRADTPPPTVKQFEALLDACDVLGDYAPQMRALVVFAAYTGMRPGELYELRWSDIDLARNRITVSRRLYRGAVDTPKSNKPKTIALPPPARDVLMRQPTRTGELVFVSMRGKQLTAATVSQYWALVKSRAELGVDFYLATKHYGVHLLYKLCLSKRAIAAQMGWSEDAVDGLLRVYGHADHVALSEVDALYSMHDSMQGLPR